MFGKNPPLTPLQLRKQLLLAESDLNRAQLERECLALRLEVHACAHRLRTVGWVVSTGAALAALVAAWRRPVATPASGKTSWWRTLLNGAGLFSSFWAAGRSSKVE